MKKAKGKSIEDSYLKYIKLSSYLFGLGDKAVYDVNEIPTSSEFYEMARKIAKDLEVDWKTMSHSDSNRIMLAMLSDSYNEMKKCEKSQTVIFSYSFKIVDKK